jgi:hypothetical protein
LGALKSGSIRIAPHQRSGNLLVPLIMALWKWLAPPARESAFDSMGRDLLAQRNKKLDWLFTALMFVGLMSPLSIALMFLKAKPSNPLLAIGLGASSFGLMVARPVLVIALITLREGVGRFREFWRYYEVKWGIGLRGIAWVYVLIGALGPVGLVLMLLGS